MFCGSWPKNPKIPTHLPSTGRAVVMAHDSCAGSLGFESHLKRDFSNKLQNDENFQFEYYDVPIVFCDSTTVNR